MPTQRVRTKAKGRKSPRAESVQPGSHYSGRRTTVNSLLQAVGYLEKNELDQIRRAYRFGEDAHAGQERQSGEAYINHPLAVARILAELHLDGRSIVDWWKDGIFNQEHKRLLDSISLILNKEEKNETNKIRNGIKMALNAYVSKSIKKLSLKNKILSYAARKFPRKIKNIISYIF